MTVGPGYGDEQGSPVFMSVRLADSVGDGTLVIRTDFTDDEVWQAVVDEAMTPVAVEFAPGWASPATLVFVDDPTLDGYSPRQLAERIGDVPPGCVFVADSVSMTQAERTVLAVTLDQGDDTRRTLRVAINVLWMVENSLVVGTMSIDEFIANADSDGVFRGFRAARPEVDIPADLQHVIISRGALHSVLVAQESATIPSLGLLEVEWDQLDFDERTFIKLPAETLRSLLETTDYSIAISHVGYADAIEALNRGGDVLAGSYEFNNGHWEFYLDAGTRAFIGAFKYVFR